jgi:hypothetical protein
MPVCREKVPELRERTTEGAEPHVSACFYVDEHPEADLLSGASAVETP